MASKAFVTEIIQLIYKIPTTFLMILSVHVILKEVKKKNVHFIKSFFFIIVCKLVNEIINIITYYVFIKLPKWGFFNKFLEENDWTARVFFVLAAQQTTFMFLITFSMSINRYVAVKYPLKYKSYFSKSNMIKTLTFFVILSILIGLGNIFFYPVYGKRNFSGEFVPHFTSTKVVYYQIFYAIFLFGTISIGTCIFNVMAILELKKHKKVPSYYKRERIYTTYSIFIFVTLSIVEAFFVIRVIARQYQINFLYHIFICYHIYAFDLPSIGDFYFLIYTSRELRNGIKKSFMCSKKATAKVSVKIPYRR
uniref:Serpentine receptor class gamma n=1 Tax=Strongyloides papillosus TaxID=174720 RepID=A0A0N5BV60_STREA